VDLGIRGRRALLSGASRGLGRACAFALAQEGVELTIVARRRDALEKTAAEISAATGANVVPVAGDITSPQGRAAALAACPTRGFGRIVNIVSRSVKIAQPEHGLSNGARSGLVGFVAGLARQTVAHNVTINNLLPGIFDSDAKRVHVRAMAEKSGDSFEQLWQSRALQNPRSVMAGRPNLAPILRFFAPSMPASLPARISCSMAAAIRGHTEDIRKDCGDAVCSGLCIRHDTCRVAAA
jgi:3-oxoacyl-[acyl-carrier protein] reductase